jgi:hypothetical protein
MNENDYDGVDESYLRIYHAGHFMNSRKGMGLLSSNLITARK